MYFAKVAASLAKKEKDEEDSASKKVNIVNYYTLHILQTIILGNTLSHGME